MHSSISWHPLDSADAVALEACSRILRAAREAIGERDRFSIVLAGGGTPERTYRLLADSKSDWGSWHVYFGDERCLTVTDPQRNSLMAARALTDKVPIPRNQIHPIPAELRCPSLRSRVARARGGRSHRKPVSGAGAPYRTHGTGNSPGTQDPGGQGEPEPEHPGILQTAPVFGDRQRKTDCGSKLEARGKHSGGGNQGARHYRGPDRQIGLGKSSDRTSGITPPSLCYSWVHKYTVTGKVKKP